MAEEMLKHKIAQHLLDIGAVKLSLDPPFTWASGIKSPIYCDNRKTLSYPHIRTRILNGFVEIARTLEIDAIAGVATAGIPQGALLADRLRLPYCYVRSKPKGHGMKNLIEGELSAGRNVLLVEDLISTGGSVIKATEALREAGHTVAHVCSVFTYGLPLGKERLSEAQLTAHCLSDFEALLKLAQSKALFSEDKIQSILQWQQNPSEWQV